MFNINFTIENKVKKLSELIIEEISRTKDNGFSELKLKFELSSYQSRLKFLEDFKKNKGFNTNTNDDKVRKINDYFTDVNYGFSV